MENYSVLMTVYKKDNHKFVKQSIDSMINQTIKTNDFVIICDGELTDELNSLLDEYKCKYNYINIYRLKENVGLGAALRFGLTKCKNRLVARMDDDDISYENRCEKELKHFEENPNVVIVGSYVNEFESNSDDILRMKAVPEKQSDILLFSKRRNPFNHSTVMFDKEKIIKIGNYSKMRTNQDVELWVRALNNGCEGYNIPEPLVLFRFDSSTYRRRKDWKNVKLMIEIWGNFLKKGYCTKIDLFCVSVMQIGVFIMPERIVRWAYNKLR